MKRDRNCRPYVRYRFKDTMGYVFFKEFGTDREARNWYERYKRDYCLTEMGNVSTIYRYRNGNTFTVGNQYGF